MEDLELYELLSDPEFLEYVTNRAQEALNHMLTFQNTYSLELEALCSPTV